MGILHRLVDCGSNLAFVFLHGQLTSVHAPVATIAAICFSLQLNISAAARRRILSSPASNIVLVALGESEEEHAALRRFEGNQRAVSARAALPAPRDALLDDSASKVGINKPALGPETASRNASSVRPSFRIKRLKLRVLKTRTMTPFHEFKQI
jgi:hypothetical protein